MEDEIYDTYDKSRIKGEFQLYVSINSYESKTINREEIIFYKIELYSYLTETEWTVNHRYSDFYELYLILSKYFFKVPNIPSKSLGKLSNVNELNKRKESLNVFVRVI
jgi:hypothetical protein